MKKRFDGYYFKHQKDGKTISFIPGVSGDGAFVQVISPKKSYFYHFPSIQMGESIQVGGCSFAKSGIHIDLPNVTGEVKYTDITPLKSDIMGPFRFFPMQCRHGVISMGHLLSGALTIDGDTVDFGGGTGYIEKDSGTSFPKSYLWLQCNDFADGCSIMVSVADIPWMGRSFEGCICAIWYQGKEYRLATYRGVKVALGEDHITLSQGKYRLEIAYASKQQGHPLASPVMGKMSGMIHENNTAWANFRFYEKGNLVFDKSSGQVSFERFPLA